MNPFLSISLSVCYREGHPILQDLSLEMQRGEILGVVGASGCGKSTLALAILQLLGAMGTKPSGAIHFNGRNLLSLREKQMRRIRGCEIALVLQSPGTALNPMLRIGTQLKEVWRAHAKGNGEEQIRRALKDVSLPGDRTFLRRYPSEISIGQGQRVLIAMAILHRPALLVADEPTSALDAITQIEILDLFQRINRDLKTGILLISHNLMAIRSICDRVAVLHEGKVVECGTVAELFSNPQHPYTKALLMEPAPQLSRAAASCRL